MTKLSDCQSWKMTNVAQEMFEYRGGIFKKSSLGTGGSSKSTVLLTPGDVNFYYKCPHGISIVKERD